LRALGYLLDAGVAGVGDRDVLLEHADRALAASGMDGFRRAVSMVRGGTPDRLTNLLVPVLG
jgi:hypothetical protein